MFKACAMPYLRELSGDVIFSHNLMIFGSGESSVESKLRDMMNELQNPTLAPYAKEGEVMLRVTAKAKTEAEAEALTVPVMDRVRGILGDIIYGVDVKSLEEVVFSLLREKSMTIATAESCTGGFIAKRLTDISGASSIFKGGAVTYASDSKVCVLKVKPETIEQFGVISGETAVEMAENARGIFKSDIAVATTGLSGPEGDGINQVGTVFIALATRDKTFVKKINSGFGRTRSRVMATNLALDMVRRYLSALPVVVEYYV